MSDTLSVKSQENAGVTYALPAKPDLTVRFRFSNTAKNLNGVTVPNYATEIIFNDNNPVTVGGASALDALSVRLRISGSLESKVRLRQLLLSMVDKLNVWEIENVMQGFRPVTPPVLKTLAEIS